MTFFLPRPAPHRPVARRRAAAVVWTAAALWFAGHAVAEPAVWTADPLHTRVHWEVMHFGTSTSRGRFDDVDVQARIDFGGRRGEVSASIGTASVSTGVPPLDAALRGEYFFASKAFERAHFVSRDLRFDGDRLVQLVGELTVRDVSIPLTLTSRRFACREDAVTGRRICGGDFDAELRRGDLGITHGLPFVADRVKLVIQVEAAGP